jgi:hypothetical protein
VSEVADEKARDILHEIVQRKVCGSTLDERVGGRAWQRPKVAISSRLYERCKLADPWDPRANGDVKSIGLGPVSLRLGQHQRRQPAPHLMPKPPKEKKSIKRDPMAGFPKIPRAKKPFVSKAVSGKSVAPKAASAKHPSDELLDEQAAKIAKRMRAAELARGGSRRRTQTTLKPREPASIGLPLRPEIAELGPEPLTTEEVASPARSTKALARGGRFRMAAKAVTQAPVMSSVLASDGEGKPPEKTPDLPAPPRRAMPSLGGGSMDDFFGAAAQMGRLRMPSSEPEPEE